MVSEHGRKTSRDDGELVEVGEQPAVADEGDEEQAVAYPREYVEEVELELQKMCEGIFASM